MMTERCWQNWDEGEIAQKVDSYWVSSAFEVSWRKKLVADIAIERLCAEHLGGHNYSISLTF